MNFCYIKNKSKNFMKSIKETMKDRIDKESSNEIVGYGNITEF